MTETLAPAHPPPRPSLGQAMRAGLFAVQMYLAMAVLAVVFTPWALVDRRGAFAGIATYCRYVRWSARRMIGLRSEIRGPVPQGACLVAAKHQSFFDIILICSVVARPRFVMKQELRRMPILGWYALRIGCVPVARGRRGQAVRKMLTDVAAAGHGAGPLIIYPQGTRVPAGESRPYKIGAAALYAETGYACVPAATNVGVFWPPHRLVRQPGLAVVEFLPEMPPGAPPERFLADLEQRIEEASERLMAEAGFAHPPRAGTES